MQSFSMTVLYKYTVNFSYRLQFFFKLFLVVKAINILTDFIIYEVNNKNKIMNISSFWENSPVYCGMLRTFLHKNLLLVNTPKHTVLTAFYDTKTHL